MIKKVIIGIGLSIMSVSGVRMFADPMEAWKTSAEVQRAIKNLKELKDNPEKVKEWLWDNPEMVEELLWDNPEKVKELLGDNPERIKELLWEQWLGEVVENKIGVSFWREVLANEETQENGLERLKELYQYLLLELKLNGFMKNDLYNELNRLKGWVDKAVNALEDGFYKTLIAIEIEI